jgi:hypothetical protein
MWVAHRGIKLSARGRIPDHVLEQYAAAGYYANASGRPTALCIREGIAVSLVEPTRRHAGQRHAQSCSRASADPRDRSGLPGVSAVTVTVALADRQLTQDGFGRRGRLVHYWAGPVGGAH